MRPYGIFGREITKYTVVCGVFIWCWTTLQKSKDVTQIVTEDAGPFFCLCCNLFSTHPKCRALHCKTCCKLICKGIAPMHALWLSKTFGQQIKAKTLTQGLSSVPCSLLPCTIWRPLFEQKRASWGWRMVGPCACLCVCVHLCLRVIVCVRVHVWLTGVVIGEGLGARVN